MNWAVVNTHTGQVSAAFFWFEEADRYAVKLDKSADCVGLFTVKDFDLFYTSNSKGE